MSNRTTVALRVFDYSAWIAVLLAVLFILRPIVHHQSPDTFYVSPTGSDIWGNGTRSNPWRTIQFAQDCSAPGDVLRLLAGTFRERVHVRRGGNQQRPVVIEADVPGTAVLSGACTPDECHKAKWREAFPGVFVTEVGWPVHMVTAEGQQLYRVPWGGVDQLRKMCSRPGAMDAFWAQDGLLYVMLAGGRRPSDVDMSWHQRVPPPREWGEFKSSNIWIEADYVILRGIRFEFGIGSAIRVWNGSNLSVEGCAFSGCTYGVQAGGGVKPANGLRVEECWYHNAPQSTWARNWLSWSEVYMSYSSSTLCCAVDRPTWIRRNLVTDFGDAVRISPGVDTSIVGKSEIVGNWMAFGTDDAIELDGPGYQVDVTDNCVIDVHEGISFSPLTDGPATVSGNFFWNPSGGLNGSQLKFIPPERDDPAEERVRGIHVHHNVICGEWLSWRANISVSDVTLNHNIFEVDHKLNPEWPLGVTEHNNLYRSPRNRLHSTASEFLRDLLRTESDPSVTATAQHAFQLLEKRPGPKWLIWNDHPTTRQLQELIQPISETHDKRNP